MNIWGTFKIVRRIGIAFVLLGIVLFVVSCGQDGNIWGDVIWDGTLFYSIGGGFPSNGVIYGATYQISAGTWSYQYYVYYGGYYYPYGTVSPSGYYYGSYTVSANPGTIPFINGADNYFQLYCSYAGMYKSGSVNSVVPPAGGAPVTPQLGTQTWTQGNLTITVTTQIAKMTPDVLAKLGQGVRK